jgi:hypothetical protein
MYTFDPNLRLISETDGAGDKRNERKIESPVASLGNEVCSEPKKHEILDCHCIGLAINLAISRTH